MKTLTWVDTTRKAIKSKLGFGWSVQGIEIQNRVVTKVAYRFASGQRAVKASRGTTALPALASQILELDWLVPEDKHDNRFTISSAGRNSTPIDMVIEQVDKAVWVNLGSISDIAENLRLGKVRENLSEKQKLVLAFIEDRDKKMKACSLDRKI